MANDLSKFSPEVWSKRVQRLLSASLVGREIANTEDRVGLAAGDKIHRPYMSDVTVQDYTKGTAVTIQDIDTTDEYLEINATKVAPFYVDAVDGVQNVYNTVDVLSRRCAYRLRDNIDQAVLGEVSNANEASSSLVTLSTSNVVSTFSNAKVTLFGNDVPNENLVTVVSPETAAIIEQYFAANGFKTADEALVNGYMGNWMGMKVYQSTNLPSAVTLNLATNPTSGSHSVTINGVTFSFVADPTSPGDVDRGVDVATSISNLVAAINGGAGAGTAYTEVSAADRRKLTNKQVTAVADTNAVNLTAYGKMSLSATLGGSDDFGDQTVSHIVGQKGAIDLVIQKEVATEAKDVADKLGKNYLTWTLYGVKTFSEGADRMFNLGIKA